MWCLQGSWRCVVNLPRPECKYGYTSQQIATIMGPRLREFRSWMSGQTISVCDGRTYNHSTKEYEPGGCGPHGNVIYSWDVESFLLNRPVTD